MAKKSNSKKSASKKSASKKKASPVLPKAIPKMSVARSAAKPIARLKRRVAGLSRPRAGKAAVAMAVVGAGLVVAEGIRRVLREYLVMEEGGLSGELAATSDHEDVGAYASNHANRVAPLVL